MLIYHQKVDTRKKILEKKTPRMGIIVHGQVKHVLTAGTGISWESRECLKITESKKSLWLLSFEHVTPNQTITPGNQNYPMYFHIKLFKSTSNLGCFARLSAVLHKNEFWRAWDTHHVLNPIDDGSGTLAILFKCTIFFLCRHTHETEIFSMFYRDFYLLPTPTLYYFFSNVPTKAEAIFVMLYVPCK